MINLTIDNKPIQVCKGTTILKAALDAEIFIPSMCNEARFPPHGSCGLCVVEIEGINRLLRACATIAAQGMVVSTASKRVTKARATLLELQFSAHTGDCKAPCQLACPAETNCQEYISLIKAGRLAEARKIMLDAHPFPASIARVCPRPCESKCRRGLVDEPINIAGLKQYAADATPRTQTSNIMPTLHAENTGKSIAIIGGGPAGLTAAYFLRRCGHRVTVYDRMPKMGGLLRYGIPEYRLPKAVLDTEIQLLTQMGIEFVNNSVIGEDSDITPQSLKQNHNAVIIAIGAANGLKMGIPGEDLPGIVSGIDFLRDAVPSTDTHLCTPPSHISLTGQDIAVIGGSNTAIDAARTALRLGAKSVTIAYRRTKDEMPADKTEISEAEAEGVLFKYLVAPIAITESQKTYKTYKLRLQIMTLGEPDVSGRRSPTPLPGKEENLNIDKIIVAIGQTVVTKGLENLANTRPIIESDPITFKTSQPGIYAIGDATGQSAYAIEAISHGKKAAAAINEYLQEAADSTTNTIQQNTQLHMQLPMQPLKLLPWETLPKILSKDHIQSTDLNHIPKAPREENKKATHEKEAQKGFLSNFNESNFNETHQNLTHQNLTPTQAANEAARCLSCGCGDYHQCKLLHLANKYDANPNRFINPKKPNHSINSSTPPHTHNPSKCILCGLCIKACSEDRAILTMANRAGKTIVAAIPVENCVKCDKCKEACPTGARVNTP